MSGDAPDPVHPAQARPVIAGFDWRYRTLSAAGTSRPSADGPFQPDGVVDDELRVDRGLVAVNGDDVVKVVWWLQPRSGCGGIMSRTALPMVSEPDSSPNLEWAPRLL